MPHASATPSRHLTVTEAAREIGISEDSLWRLLARGELPCLRIPSTGRGSRAGRVLIARAELERALVRWQSEAR